MMVWAGVAVVAATVALPPELARVLTDYEKAWQARDAAALAALFAEDGFVLPSGARRPCGGGRTSSGTTPGSGRTRPTAPAEPGRVAFGPTFA